MPERKLVTCEREHLLKMMGLHILKISTEEVSYSVAIITYVQYVATVILNAEDSWSPVR